MHHSIIYILRTARIAILTIYYKYYEVTPATSTDHDRIKMPLYTHMCTQHTHELCFLFNQLCLFYIDIPFNFFLYLKTIMFISFK